MSPRPDTTPTASPPASPLRSSHEQRPRAKSFAGAGHKKSTSGSIFSRLPFFRSSPEQPSPASPTADDVIPFPDVPDHDEDLALRSPALTGIIDDADGKTRNRKGSLRKAALLGTGRLRLDRRFSSADAPKVKSPTKRKASDIWRHRHDSGSTSATPRASVDENSIETAKPSLDGAEGRDLLRGLQVDTKQPPIATLLSPLTSPSAAYASTTDDDDRYTIPSTVGSLSIPVSKPSLSPSPPSSESSFTNPPTLSLLRSSSKPTTASPLSIPPLTDSNEDWDYSATEWWGWIILLVTWIVFVVGMGSCLGVWSWAWDVGETPYAPPELEDDPTLPIVGYYPALMVLTAVMSWIWVVVAWMGMKFFKHAKIDPG